MRRGEQSRRRFLFPIVQLFTRRLSFYEARQIVCLTRCSPLSFSSSIFLSFPIVPDDEVLQTSFRCSFLRLKKRFLLRCGSQKLRRYECGFEDCFASPNEYIVPGLSIPCQFTRRHASAIESVRSARAPSRRREGRREGGLERHLPSECLERAHDQTSHSSISVVNDAPLKSREGICMEGESR